MKKSLLTVSLMLMTMSVFATNKNMVFYFNTGDDYAYQTTMIDSVWFSENGLATQLSYNNTLYTFETASIDSIRYEDAVEKEDVVYITWNGDTATVTNPWASKGVAISVSGADVTINSTADKKVEYVLSGYTEDGFVKIYSANKKFQLTLNGLNLTNQRGAAINSQSGKECTIKNQNGFTNTLCDGKKYTIDQGSEDEKGTIFSEGQIIFSGKGTLNVTSLKKHAIASDDYIEVDNGFINVLAAGKDAMHANDSIIIVGGQTVLTATSDGIDCEGVVRIADGSVTVVVNEDDVKAISADTTLIVTGGTIDITTTGKASKGMKSDGNILISGGETTITQSGDTLVEEGDVSYVCGIKADGDVIISGGRVTINSSATGGKGISTDGTINTEGGEVIINLTGSGGMVNISGVTDAFTTAGFKADGNITIHDGSITITATGQKGTCGIKATGALVIGTDSLCPTLYVKTTGTYVQSAGSGGGGQGWRAPAEGGPGGPGEGGGGGNDTYYGDPKAIKILGDITINNGDIAVTTTRQGGEGIESKSTITVNDGTIKVLAYDDAINAKSKITFNGGHIYARSSNNDGIDSNGQGFVFNGGVVMAGGTNQPEEGFDCDSYPFYINGGTVIGIGGATSKPTSAKQAVGIIQNLNITGNKYIALKDTEGNVLFAYKCPKTISNAGILISHPMLKANTSFTLVYNATSVDNPTESKFDGIFCVGGTLTGGSTRTFKPSTK